jgi:hypothetical protein
MTTKVTGSVIESLPADKLLNVVLVANSFVSQAPTQLDTPMQIEYGAAQEVPGNEAWVDATGKITFNVTGSYHLQSIYPISRETSAGEALIFLRIVLNGVQLGPPIAALMDDDDMMLPLQLIFQGQFQAGDELISEFVRDGAGINSGGLVSETSSIGWGASPSANLRIIKIG